MPQVTELSPDQLRRICDPASFTFHSTDDLPSLAEVIGQERALRSVAFGIDIKTPGYHMYALGPNGTGKTKTVQKFLQQEAANRPVPDDWLYVNNFSEADKPRAFRLPPGVGCKLREDMDKLVEELRRDVPRAFESQEYQSQQEEVGQEFEKQRDVLFGEAEKEAEARGLAILPTPQGLMIAPAVNGKVLTPDQVQHLSDEKRQQLAAAQEEIQSKLRDTMRSVQQLQRNARERGNEMDRNVVAYAVGHWIDELRERYAEYPPVVKLLDEIRDDILKNVQAFKQIRQIEQMQTEPTPFAAMLGREMPSFDQYKVNLIVNNCNTKGAPVILVRNPSYNNLIGRIEHTGQFGMLVTNFNLIKGGLLHKANGGYIMINVRDLLMKPLAWEGLKRALKSKTVEIESMAEMYGAFATHTLEPEPIPLDIKVILIGDPYIYYLLYALDPEFQELFKVKADFTTRMDRTPETTEQYASFIATVVREENLRHFDPSGVAKVVEHGSRIVQDQRKLATKFGDVVDLIRESSYWARKNNHDLVTGNDVTQAIKEKVYRSDLVETLLQEMITDGTIMIDTDKMVAGQINGLAVLSLGDYAFGKPSRITARTYVGDAGVVNIEREA
ncbi:MAG TPA: ATP-binding protein, partial [Armatimonadota bacterium]|nr:ATP-binding protein [Armatimonadota bacterium]